MAYAVGEDRSDFQPAGRTWAANDFGFTKFSESTGWKSSTARANWANMKAEGVARGAYHFFHPAVSGAAQADFFTSYVRACGGWQPGDMFACDVEISVGEDGMETIAPERRHRLHAPLERMPEHLMGTTTGAGALAFCNEVARIVGPRCPVLLYTYSSFRNLVSNCTRYPLWIASYSASPPSSVAPWSHWTFWQNSDRGGQGGGDTDRFHSDRAALHSWLHPSTPPTNWTETIVSELPTLKLGAKDTPGHNQAVGKMQALIAFVGTHNTSLTVSAALKPDGVFGPTTLAAVNEIQAFYKIPGGNGECGQRTWTHLLLGFT